MSDNLTNSTENLINFKYGTLPDDSATLSNLLEDNGTIGLVQYEDSESGYFTIKIDGNLCDVLLPPCDIKGLPFLGQGSKIAPAYSRDLSISSITFFDKNKDENEQSVATIETDPDSDTITITCPSSTDDAEMSISLCGYISSIDISQSDGGNLWLWGCVSPGYNCLSTGDAESYSDLTISEDMYFWALGFYQMTSPSCEFTLGDGTIYEYSIWATWDLPLSMVYNKEGKNFNNILLDSNIIALNYNNEKNGDCNNSKILLNNNLINLLYCNTTDNYTTDIDLTKSLTLSYIKEGYNSKILLNNNLINLLYCNTTDNYTTDIDLKDSLALSYIKDAINNSLTITENQFKINTTNNSIILNEDENNINMQLSSSSSIDLYINGTEQVSLTSTDISFNNKIIISANSYGTSDPPTGAVAGLVYFKILSD